MRLKHRQLLLSLVFKLSNQVCLLIIVLDKFADLHGWGVEFALEGRVEEVRVCDECTVTVLQDY